MNVRERVARLIYPAVFKELDNANWLARTWHAEYENATTPVVHSGPWDDVR